MFFSFLFFAVKNLAIFAVFARENNILTPEQKFSHKPPPQNSQ